MGPRSGGCQTCRRRHVKCDERRPACQRCERGRFRCGGYAREHRFVFENAKAAQTVQKARDSVARKPGQGALSVLPQAQTSPSTGVTQISGYRQSLPQSPGYAAFEDNIYLSFLISYFFEGKLNEWFSAHVDDKSSTSMEMSTRALGAMYFGRMHHNQDIVRRASELYGKALISLNGDLQDEERACSATVLASAYSLELYEFMTSGSSFGWLKHAGGVGRLMELRGPWRHQSALFRDFLEGNRVTIALEFLIRKKRCFLEDPDWKTVPWALDPSSKLPVFYLHDILVDIPGLMEDATILESMEDDTEQLRIFFQSLSHNIIAHIRMLYRWRVSWQRMNPSSASEVPTSLLPGPEIYFSPNVLHFSTIEHANEITFYNTLLLLLLKLGSRVIGPEFDPHLLSLDLHTDLNYGPLHPPGLAPSPQAIATEICRSVEYHLNDVNQTIVALFLLFPLRVAYESFEPESGEAKWLGNIMDKIADIGPFESSRELNKPQWP